MINRINDCNIVADKNRAKIIKEHNDKNMSRKTLENQQK